MEQRDCWIVSGILDRVVRCLRHSSHILSEVIGGGAPQAMQKAPVDMVLPALRSDRPFQGFPKGKFGKITRSRRLRAHLRQPLDVHRGHPFC